MTDTQRPSALDKQQGGEHYKIAIQPIQFIHANQIPFIEANVIKYVCRHRLKHGAEDLRKAIHYIEMLIELEYDELAKTEAQDNNV